MRRRPVQRVVSLTITLRTRCTHTGVVDPPGPPAPPRRLAPGKYALGRRRINAVGAGRRPSVSVSKPTQSSEQRDLIAIVAPNSKRRTETMLLFVPEILVAALCCLAYAPKTARSAAAVKLRKYIRRGVQTKSNIPPTDENRKTSCKIKII